MFERFRTTASRLFRAAPFLPYVILGIASVALFLWIQASGNFPDPDSFYHARLGALIAEEGPVHRFPWLAETVFADAYVDHHFLYHVLLMPFVRLAPTLAEGARVSAIALATLTVLASAFLLRRLGAGPVAFLAPALFLVSNPLLFRLNLAKTPSLALLTLFVSFYAASRRRPLLLGTTAFLYVWLYDGWILLLPLVGCVILADALTPEPVGTHTDEAGWHWRHRLLGRRSREIALATILGIVLGHVINPYFPENLAFEWLHIVRIGLIGFRDTIGVGAEWYPYEPLELLAVTPTTFLALLLGAVAFFVAAMRSAESGRPFARERVRDTVALFLFAALALVFAIRSRRNVEYFVPFAVFASVSAFDLFHRARGWEALRSARSLFGRAGVGIAVVAAYMILVLTLTVWRDWKAVRRDFDRGIPPTKYAGLARWLAENTPRLSVVFHSDWDDFPYFFLQNTHNRWLVGLDPAFMYVKDPGKFREWVEITQGRVTDRLADRVRDDFGAEYAFVDADHATLRGVLDADPRFRALYRDGEGSIYAVLPNAAR